MLARRVRFLGIQRFFTTTAAPCNRAFDDYQRLQQTKEQLKEVENRLQSLTAQINRLTNKREKLEKLGVEDDPKKRLDKKARERLKKRLEKENLTHLIHSDPFPTPWLHKPEECGFGVPCPGCPLHYGQPNGKIGCEFECMFQNEFSNGIFVPRRNVRETF